MLNLNNPCEGNAHETPIKRGKAAELEPHTAESEQPSTSSLADLDAKDLYEKFNELVRVTVDEEPFGEDFEDEVSRKLDYEHPHTLRIDFDPTTSSMKKKPSLHHPRTFTGINLFQVPPQQRHEPNQLEIKQQREEKQFSNSEKPPMLFYSPVHKEREAYVGLSRAARKHWEES